MTHCDLYPAVSLSPPFAPKVGDLVGFVDRPDIPGDMIPATVLIVRHDAAWNRTRYHLRLHRTPQDCNQVLAYKGELRPLTGSIGGAG